MRTKEKQKEYNKRYHDGHREESKKYQKEHREERNTRRRERYHTDEQYREKMKGQSRVNGKKRTRVHRQHLEYGVSENVLEVLTDKGCAICGANAHVDPTADLEVDHDHRTGKVRGILCHDCNLAIACFHDDPFAIEKALQYILHGGIYE